MLQILQELGVDYVDESEVLTPADETYHVEKNDFKVPFVCGCRNLGEALRRISEGAAMSEFQSLHTKDFIYNAKEGHQSSKVMQNLGP